MRIAVTILFCLLVVLGAHHLGGIPQDHVADEAAMGLGFVLIVSYLLGSLLPRFGLPMITGYMLAGILFGPSFMEMVFPGVRILSHEGLQELSLFNHIALGLIAFTAGGELKWSVIKKRWKSYLSITLVQSMVVFVGVGAIFYLGASMLGPLSELGTTELMVAAVLLACTAVAKSPATTIAVINETRSAGPMTDVALGVTVIKDLVVIGFFAAAFSVSKALLSSGGGGHDGSLFFQVSWEIAGSILGGALLGYILTLFIERLGEELPLVLLGVAFLAVYLAEHVHLHGLMICMTAGFVVENFSEHGENFIHAVEHYSLPVYVVFFTLAGAELEMHALLKVGGVATILCLLRAVFTYFGTAAGGALAGESRVIIGYSGLGFLGQAGVTLGFAVLISEGFGELGKLLSTIIVAGVTINQVVGPVAFRYALGVAEEVGKRGDLEFSWLLGKQNSQNALSRLEAQEVALLIRG